MIPCVSVDYLPLVMYAWVLGDLPSKNAMHVVTELSQSGALFAQNHYNTEFGERTAFFDASTSQFRINLHVLSPEIVLNF